MTTVPAESQEPSDGELIESVRNGSTEAYAELYQRHGPAARNMARQVARSATEVDDLVSEAFAKVLGALRAGNGPSTAFRAYLLTSLRHIAYDRTRRERGIQLTEDIAQLPGADVGVPFTDTAVEGFERSLAARAFAQLPERWRMVLWHLEVEGEPPAKVAPLLGLTPNGVSVLAYRAREGLRQAYLQVHLGRLDIPEPGVENCRSAADRLGAWTRGGLSKRATAQVELHLDGCERCRGLAAELTEVNGSLRAIIAPLVLGGTALGYLSVSGGSAAADWAASSACGGAGALTAVPRQALTSVAPIAALVVAVVAALMSGASVPERFALPPTSPVMPEPPAPKPAPALQNPQPSRNTRQPAPAKPGVPATPPAPAGPELEASAAGGDLQLLAGGPVELLPITVSNDGESPSEPLTTTLSLPPDITAQIAQSTPNPRSSAGPPSPRSPQRRSVLPAGPATASPQSASPRSPGPARAQAANALLVRCDRTSRGTTCTTDRDLAPGDSFAFDFSVRADETATSGEITGTISAGSAPSLRLSAVAVQVRPADAVPVKASASHGLGGWTGFPRPGNRIRIDVRNEGGTAGRAEVVVRLPRHGNSVAAPDCTPLVPASGEVRCAALLAPGESSARELWVLPLNSVRRRALGHEIVVPVTATLGRARDTDSAELGLWHPWVPLLPPEPGPGQPEAPAPDVPTERPAQACASPSKPAPSKWSTPDHQCWPLSEPTRPSWLPTPTSTPERVSPPPTEQSNSSTTPSQRPPEPTGTSSSRSSATKAEPRGAPGHGRPSPPQHH